MEYLAGYRPLWLDPDLLPGPSILEVLEPREEAWLSVDPAADLEWRAAPPRDPADAAVALVDAVRLGEGQALLSEGDVDILHRFLKSTRSRPPRDPAEREALAALCRHIASIPSMPPHLADEYATRARVLSKPVGAPPPAGAGAPEVTPAIEEEPEPMAPEEIPATEETVETPPAEAPATEPTVEEPTEGSALPAPSEEIPPPLPPEPEPEPEPEGPDPEVLRVQEEAREAVRLAQDSAAKAAEEAGKLVIAREALEKERSEIGSWVERQSKEFEARESEILERAKSVQDKEAELRAKEGEVVAKVTELEAKEREVREKIGWVEKDERRRAVMEFLDTVPGMTIKTAKAVTNAFPDMDSLRAAEVKALSQADGMTEAMAKEIRALVAPEALEAPMDLREQAHLLLEDGDTEGALRIVEQALKERPDDETAWFDKAELLVMLERPAEALHCYTRVLDLNRGNRHAWYEKANLLFGEGHLAEAMDCLREVLRLDPSKAPDLLLKAEQLRIDDKLNDAALLFQTVVDAEPENARAILGLADCLIGLGDADAAEALVTRALGKDPANPGALYRKGTLLDRKGRWGAALQLYNRAIALKWDYADPWIGKGDVYLAHERPKDALECFDRALLVDNGRVEAWLGKAQGHWALEEKDTAQACLSRALQLNPDSEAVKEVADLFERVKEAVTEAPEELPADFKAFIEAVEPEKEETETLLQLAEMALEGGDADMAILRYDQALEKDPRSPDAWTGKGIALQHQEKYSEALACYDKALEIHPGHDLATKWRETCAKRLAEGGAGAGGT